MLFMPEGSKAYLCLEPTDMRRSFDKLALMTCEHLGKDPQSGDFFLFRNRAANLLKVLYYDGASFCLWYKRLSRGSFVIKPGLDSDFSMSKDMFYDFIS